MSTAMNRYTFAADTFDWCIKQAKRSDLTFAERDRMRRRSELMAYAMERIDPEVQQEARQWVREQFRSAFAGSALPLGPDFARNTLRR